VADFHEKRTIPQLVRESPVPVADSTIRRAVREQRLPAERVLGKYRVDMSDFVKWLRGEPTSKPGPR